MNYESVYQEIVSAAREELLPRFLSVTANKKQDGSLLTEADLAMQSRLKQRLSDLYPDFGMIGEEMHAREQQAQLDHDNAVWVLDPLDGTTNYVNGVPFFCVSLALLINRQPVLAAIYDPINDELFSAEKNQGAFLNQKNLQTNQSVNSLGDTIALIDYKRLPRVVKNKLIHEQPFMSQRSFGSVALEWCWLAAGRGHLYLHGRQKFWDYCAGWLILQEAGGASYTLDDEPVYQYSLTERSGVAASNVNLLQQWSQWLNNE